jgi:hypothetical protein
MKAGSGACRFQVPIMVLKIGKPLFRLGMRLESPGAMLVAVHVKGDNNPIRDQVRKETACGAFRAVMGVLSDLLIR